MTNEADQTIEVPRYPLANDVDGNPLNVPPEAVAWRIRKLALKAGRPKLLFDAETGRPLELPIAASFSDFTESVTQSGRYRLEAIDAHGRLIPGCVAVTELVIGDEEPTPTPQADMPQLIQLVAQLVETNSRVMQAMASAFGQVHPAPPPQPVVVPAPSANEGANNSSMIPTLIGAFEMLKMMNAKAATTPTATAPTEKV